MAALTQPGTSVEEDHGPLTLKAVRGIDCLTVQTRCGTHRIAALTHTFGLDRVPAARVWWKTIADLADTHTPVWQIEAAMSALIEAAVAAQSLEVTR